MNGNKKGRLRLLQQIVNLRTLAAAAIAAISGGVLLWVVANLGWFQKHSSIASLLTQVASILIASAAITLLWELAGKRAFAEEVLEKTNLSKELTQAGIIAVTSSFHKRELNWVEFFESACEIDLFFLYAHTWRSAHRTELREFVSVPRRRLRVILPDPETSEVINTLGTKLNTTGNELKQRISEARDVFADLRKRASANGSVVEIWFLPSVPTFSFYCSNRLAILALYTHRKEQAEVPTFVCRNPGTIYQYIRKEVHGMVEGENPVARKWEEEPEGKDEKSE